MGSHRCVDSVNWALCVSCSRLMALIGCCIVVSDGAKRAAVSWCLTALRGLLYRSV